MSKSRDPRLGRFAKEIVERRIQMTETEYQMLLAKVNYRELHPSHPSYIEERYEFSECLWIILGILAVIFGFI